MGEIGTEKEREAKYQKSYFDVLGLCCSSEVPLIEKILNSLDGIQRVSVIVPSKTVIVVHDSLIISQLQIVKALNQARLEASIRTYGTSKIITSWPSPYIMACGGLLLVSMFKSFFHPLKWLAVAAIGVGILPIMLRSFAAIRRFNLDINILLLIAVAGALALRDYTEAGFIVFLFTIAEWLESMASHKATAGMSALMNMAPQKATLAETGQVVDARDVQINTTLAVKAGEVIPIDGVVIDGHSEVDERTLTGESFPVPKQADSLVWAGTLNIDGYISVRTTALAENSAVAKMVRLVEEAQNSRSKTQRLIDSSAKYYTPAAVILAGGVALVPLVMGVHNPKHWFKLALVLLVSACPCALVLSTPVATFCALLKAARNGLLIKGGDVLEALSSIRVVAFDKTGTITRGEFTVIEFRLVNNIATMEKLLYWVSSIERKSSHPMASALVDYAQWKSVEPEPENVTEFQIHAGEGIHGKIDGRSIYIGNKRIATRAGCQTVPSMENVQEGVTLGYVFSNAVPIGIFTLSDTCRTGAAEAIKELKSLRVKSAMLTGDSTAAAMHAQNQLGNAIEMVHAELLPEDKVRLVEGLKTKEGPTAMVGDGMNDAPALAMANVGISMGISGSAVAMETSHITLMSNDVSKIPKAIQLARRTQRKIILNILFSVITKVAILVLSFVGHPLLWAAVLADVGTCILVILNSMTLLRTKTPKQKKCCGLGNKSKACCENETGCHDHRKGHEHGCNGHEKAQEHSCNGHTHEHGYHDHHHGHKCHGNGKMHSHSCYDHDKAHNHGCHDHDKEHTHSCHDDEKAPEHGCCDNLKAAAGDCCNSEKANESKFQDKKNAYTHDCHEQRKAHAHGCHEHGKADGCHDLIQKHENGCHNHENVNEYDCHSHDEHIDCHDHRNEEESIHDNCSSRCEKLDSCMDSLSDSCCCAESAMKTSHEHSIKISCGEGMQTTKSFGKHSENHIISHCKAYVMEDGNTCAAMFRHPPANNAAGACLEDKNRNNGISGCCIGSRKECGRKYGCSTSVGIRRRTGGCCRSYRMECGKRHACCGGAVVQPPEIIIE